MKFSMLKDKDVVVVELHGEVWGDWECIGLKDSVVRMLGAGERKFVIDLESIESLNSAGIGILLAVQECVRRAQGTLRLCNVSERARRAFAISDAWKDFQTQPSRMEALLSLEPSPPRV
jgi:anti-anti-sigma factor